MLRGEGVRNCQISTAAGQGSPEPSCACPSSVTPDCSVRGHRGACPPALLSLSPAVSPLQCHPCSVLGTQRSPEPSCPQQCHHPGHSNGSTAKPSQCPFLLQSKPTGLEGQANTIPRLCDSPGFTPGDQRAPAPFGVSVHPELVTAPLSQPG